MVSVFINLCLKFKKTNKTTTLFADQNQNHLKCIQQAQSTFGNICQQVCHFAVR